MSRGRVSIFVLSTLAASCAWAGDCPDPLFMCESSRPGKFIAICATEVEAGRRWENIQYRFGAEGKTPELAYPADASRGASQLFFSHESRGSDYRVSVRFRNGDYTYRVYSHSGKQSAGVLVTDKSGQQVSDLRCIERPTIFPSYLRQALACDAENPHGTAACKEQPFNAAR